MYIDPEYKLASLDVVSLFTNVPHEWAFESIERRWDLISGKTQIPKDEFMRAITLILNSTFFAFKKIIYKQTFGTPMGSPLSPIIADLVLQDLEQSALIQLPIRLPIYFRYVDDILLAAPNDCFDTILEIFNSFHERIKFTLEISNNDRINFLDITIINDGHGLVFDCYKKPSFSGRYVNFYSQHPMSQKKGIVYGLVDKVLLLSHPMFHETNLKKAIDVLLDNCFPLTFIFSTINMRIKQLFYKGNNSNKEDKKLTSSAKNEYFTIPYVNSVSESFLPVCERFGFRIAYSIHNTLRKFIKRGKDALDLWSHRDVVYKISCNDCEATYIGQTKRQLGTRIQEHIKDINKKSGILSVISDHRLDCDHEMNWNGVEIVDTEPSYGKRLISEMIYIKKQKHALNKQSDTELLSDIYLPIMELP